MTDKLITALVTVALAIIGLAGITALLSRSANTTGVISAGGSGLSKVLCTALSPITGGCNSLIEDVSSTISYG